MTKGSLLVFFLGVLGVPGVTLAADGYDDRDRRPTTQPAPGGTPTGGPYDRDRGMRDADYGDHDCHRGFHRGADVRDGDQHDPDFDCPRFYLGFGALWAIENFHTGSRFINGGRSPVGANPTVDVDDSFGSEGRVGYRILRHLAIEGQAQY